MSKRGMLTKIVRKSSEEDKTNDAEGRVHLARPPDETEVDGAWMLEGVRQPETLYSA